MKIEDWCKRFFITISILAMPALLFAQSEQCGDDPFDPSPCDLPLDTYVFAVAIVVVLFAAWYLHKQKKPLSAS